MHSNVRRELELWFLRKPIFQYGPGGYAYNIFVELRKMKDEGLVRIVGSDEVHKGTGAVRTDKFMQVYGRDKFEGVLG